MFFWKRRKPLQISMETDPRICLKPNGFYLNETPENPANKLYCIYSLDENGDVKFPDLAMESAVQMLEDFPTVVNQLSCIDLSANIKEEPFVQQYLQTGGTLTLVGERMLLTVTAGADRSLIDSIPSDDRLYYVFDFCGFEGKLPADFVYRYPAHFGRYPFALRVYYHESPDFLLFETGRDPKPYIEQIRQICEKHGRILTKFDH
jgi:hypothetical protein